MVYILVSYLIGTWMSAWFVGRYYGKDLRQAHSGNLGARNAGRTLGKWAFVLTAAGDVLKGSAVILLGRYMNIEEWLIAAGLLAVVCGHLYPFWLNGKGGKGVATVLGAMLIFSWQASIVFIVGFLAVLAVRRSATLSLMAAFVLYSGALFYWQVEGTFLVSCAIALVIWRHRMNILERVR